MNKYSGTIEYKEPNSIRLDVYLSSLFSHISRTIIQKNIKDANVKVNGQIIKSNHKLSRGDVIKWKLHDYDVTIADIPAEHVQLDILYQDGNVLVINKPSGMATHPTPNLKEHTLVNALLGMDNNISDAIYDTENASSRIRPGIVHRLDKYTTGVIIVAKNPKSLRSLSLQIKHRNVIKKYYSLNLGWPSKNSGHLENYLGRNTKKRQIFTEVGEEAGKKAISDYHVVSYFKTQSGEEVSLLQFTILTGRTHQIRAQSLLMGNPVLGDITYSNQQSQKVSEVLGINRQMLHSYSLSVTLIDEKVSHIFSASLPPDFTRTIDKLNKITPAY